MTETPDLLSDCVRVGTHRHWAHSGRVWSTGEPQVMLGDVLAGSHDGDVLPADALLCPVRQVQVVDGEDQRLWAKLLLETSCPFLLLGFLVRVVKVQPSSSTFPFLARLLRIPGVIKWFYCQQQVASFWWCNWGSIYRRPRLAFPPLPRPPRALSLSLPRPAPPLWFLRDSWGRRSLEMLLSDCEPESLGAKTQHS